MKLNEYELLYLARQNDEEAFKQLLELYTPMFYSLYKEVHRFGDTFTSEDALQAGSIALNHAIYCYREDKDMAFHNFVRMCAKREMQSWRKREMANTYFNNEPVLSLDYELRDSNGLKYLDATIVNSRKDDVSIVATSQCIIDSIFKLYPKDTAEGKILSLRLQGYSYREISRILNISTKRVDNIYNRLKKKLRYLFD